MKVILIPGMGCHPVLQSNWYNWFASELALRPKVTEPIVSDFPDPYSCRESVWVPYIENTLGPLDENTILVGHSSGACAAMRILEKIGKNNNSNNDSNLNQKQIAGAILVATAYTDGGDEREKASEYFDREWDWNAVRKGAKQIHIFHSDDDHLIPVQEARFISNALQQVEEETDKQDEKVKLSNFEYHEMHGFSHFFEPWKELLTALDEKFLKETIEVPPI